MGDKKVAIMIYDLGGKPEQRTACLSGIDSVSDRPFANKGDTGP